MGPCYPTICQFSQTLGWKATKSMKQKFVNRLLDGTLINLVFLERYQKNMPKVQGTGNNATVCMPFDLWPKTFALNFSGIILSRTFAPYYPFGQRHIFITQREWEILESKRLYFSLKPAASYFYSETSFVFSLIPWRNLSSDWPELPKTP